MVTASRSPGYECGEERRAGEELGLQVRRGAGERQSERGEPERRGRQARVTSEGSGERGCIGRLIYRTLGRPAIQRLTPRLRDPTAASRACPVPPVSPRAPGPALWADLSAQAWARLRAGPGTGTGEAGPYRARAVLFRTGPMPARFAWPIWKFITL